MTTLSLADWLNFSAASIEAEKTFIGLGPVFKALNGIDAEFTIGLPSHRTLHDYIIDPPPLFTSYSKRYRVVDFFSKNARPSYLKQVNLTRWSCYELEKIEITK